MARKSEKRESLERALIADSGAVQESDYLLGERFALGFNAVRNIRRELERRGLIEAVTVRVGRDGHQRNTALIGEAR